jgi:hypothetical protein
LEVLEKDPKERNKKFGVHKMTKPYLGGQKENGLFVKAHDSL